MFYNRSKLTVFCLLFVTVAVFLGCTSETKTLKLTPSKLDFGSVYIGDTYSIDIVLKNKYGKLILISNISISGTNDYTITAGGSIPINLDNNAEHTLSIEFAPTVAGPIVGLLSITHDASAKPKEVDLTGMGEAVARIVLSENSFDFDKRLINRTHTHDFDIENIGTADLSINGLNFTGMGATAFKSTAAPITIIPGTKTAITITFETPIIGNYIADLEIYHNGVNENSPLIYPVTGEAIDVDPQITLSRTSPWDLGSVAKTIPSTQICEIENTGIDPLTVTSATLATGTTITIDSLKDSNGNVINFPQIIAVAAKIMLAIKFSPSANTTYNDTLTLVHDGTNEVSPLDVALAGEGRDEITKTFTYSGAPENWTVPAGVSVMIAEVWGSQGAGGSGGKGARMKGTCVITPGDTLEICAGGMGSSASGGEASYVASGATLYIMAGAGGGGSYQNGLDAVITENGTKSYQSNSMYVGGDAGTGGNGGQGGPGGWGTGGGGGWLSAGGNASGTVGGAIKGKGSGSTTYAGGAGGGYSGGGGCAMDSGWSTAGGGSGGSKNTGTNQSNTAGTRTGNGEVKIIY